MALILVSVDFHILNFPACNSIFNVSPPLNAMAHFSQPITRKISLLLKVVFFMSLHRKGSQQRNACFDINCNNRIVPKVLIQGTVDIMTIIAFHFINIKAWLLHILPSEDQVPPNVVNIHGTTLIVTRRLGVYY